MKTLLLLLLISSPSDTAKIDLQLRKIWEIKYSEPKMAFLIADSAISLADNILDEKRQGNTRYYKSMLYYLNSNYDSSEIIIKDIFPYYRRIQNNYGLASLYNLLGLIYERKGWYEKAIESYIKSQKLASLTNNLISQANPLHNIGLLHSEMDNHSEALNYYLKAYKIRQSIQDTTFLIQSIQSIGTAYLQLVNLDSAEFFLNKGLKLSASTSNLFDQSNLLNSLGLIYVLKNDLNTSEKYFRKSILISDSALFTEGKIRSQINLADVFTKKKKFIEAKSLGLEALASARKTGLKKEELEALSSLATTAEASGNYKDALSYFKNTTLINDSITGVKKSRQVEELKSIYDSEKKEQLIAVQQSELANKDLTIQRNLLFIVLLITGFFSIIIIILINRKRQKVKQQQVLQEQKTRYREAQIAAVVESQESERKRFAADLHDGMGQLIAALQVNIQSLKNTNNALQQDSIYENTKAILKDVHLEIRNIAFNLMPQTLINEGLESAIKELVVKINSAGSINIQFNSLDISALNEVVQISLYRIVQEFISNILKHGNATSIIIDLTGHNDELVLIIEDDGEGYDLIKLQNSTGNGWRNINTRLNLISASCEIDTKIGRKNNTIIISMPLKYVKNNPQTIIKTTKS